LDQEFLIHSRRAAPDDELRTAIRAQEWRTGHDIPITATAPSLRDEDGFCARLTIVHPPPSAAPRYHSAMQTARVLCLAVVAMLAVRLGAGTLTVTTTNDTGSGSLHEALQLANAGQCGPGKCIIDFRIPGPVPPSGYFTIRQRTLLPHVTASVEIHGETQASRTGDTNPLGPEIEIDGTDAPLGPGLKFLDCVECRVDGLAIHSFGGNGFVVDRGSGNSARDIYFGVDPTGRIARPNGANGALFIDTTGAILFNCIASGNRGNGVLIRNAFVEVWDCRMGLGSSDGYRLGNGANGVDVETIFRTTIARNQIAFNEHNGIIVGPRSHGVGLERNLTYRNALMNIDLGHDGPDPNDVGDLDDGPNGRMNAPVLDYAFATARSRGYVVVEGTVRTKPNQRVTIDAYVAGHRNRLGFGEARFFIGSVTTSTDAQGRVDFVIDPAFNTQYPDVLAPGGYVVATARTSEGTSELSEPYPVRADVVEVTTTADSGTGSLRWAIENVNQRQCDLVPRPCWIAFHIDEAELDDGLARFELFSPLPAMTGATVYLDGNSQAYYTGDRKDGIEVELSGANAGPNAVGIEFGTDLRPAHVPWLRGMRIQQFSSAGVRVVGQWPLIEHVESQRNGGSGIALFGGLQPVVEVLRGVRNVVSSDNGGNGLYIDGHGFPIYDSAFVRNYGAGVFVANGNLNSIRKSTIAHNGSAGVVTLPFARAVGISASIFDNLGPGIDRNFDGPTPNDVSEADGVVDAPVLIDARYDAATNRTVVRGRVSGPNHPELPLGPGGPRGLSIDYFVTGDLDAEAEREVSSNGTERFTGNEFTATIGGDLRGLLLTATRNLYQCGGSSGCGDRDTSEISNAVRVE
jgi:hypothetical protein